MKIARYFSCLWLIACFGTAKTSPTVRVTVAGLKQALASPLGNLTLAGADLSVACQDGGNETARPIGGTLDRIEFSDVRACGPAALLLSVQVQTAAGAVTAFLGSATTTLTPGEVKVNFAGSLAGELALSSTDGETFSCTGAGNPIEVPATGIVVALPSGTYTLVCTGSLGDTSTSAITVTAAAQTSLSLPATAAGTPALKLFAIAPIGFNVSNGFLFNSNTIDYSQVVPLETSQLVVTALAQAATTVVSLNGAVTTQSSTVLAFTGNALDITVTVSDGGVSASDVVHVTRATANDDATLSNISFFAKEFPPLLSPAFSRSTFAYALAAASGSTAPLTVSPDLSDANATFALNGVPNPSDPSVTLQTGANSINLHVVAEDGFTFNDYDISVPQVPVDASDDSLLAISATHGALTPAFDPKTLAGYVLFLSSRHVSNTTLRFVPAQANAQVEFNNQTSNGSTLLGLAAGANDEQIQVIAADSSSQTYDVNAVGGLVSNISSGIFAFLGFAPNVYVYANADPNCTSGCTLNVVAADASVKLSVNGQTLVDASDAILPDLASGIDPLNIEALAPDGETDSYWLNVNLSLGATETLAFTSPSTHEIQLADISGTSFQNLRVVSTPTYGTHHPDHIVAGINGRQVYFSADEGVGWVSLTGNSGGFATLPSGGAAQGLSIDPKGRFVFAIDAGSIVTFAVAADGSLSLLSQSDALGLSAIAQDPIGNFVYGVAGSAVLMLEVAPNGAVGQSVVGSVQVTGGNVSQVAADASGTFIYFTDTDTNVWWCSISSPSYDSFVENSLSPKSFSNAVGLAIAGDYQTLDVEFIGVVDNFTDLYEFSFSGGSLAAGSSGLPTLVTAPAALVADHNSFYYVAQDSGMLSVVGVSDSQPSVPSFAPASLGLSAGAAVTSGDLFFLNL